MLSTASASKYAHDAFDFVLANQQATLACALSGAVLAAVLMWRRANRDLPPGPRMLMFGSFFDPKSDEDVKARLLKLREDYGDIVSVRAFSTVFIFLNSYEAVKETYVDHSDCVSGRKRFKIGTRLDDEFSPGLINADGPIWQEHRRFVLATLRDFGFGKNLTESMIKDEVENLYRFFEVECQGGKSVDASDALTKSATNVICSLVFGERTGAEKEFEDVLKLLRKNRVGNVPFFIVLLIRFFMALPGDVLKIKKAFGNLDKILDYVDSKIKAHRVKHTEGNDADLIDAYLTAQAQQERENPGKHTFTDFQLTRIIFEFFFAGTDTTASMLIWFVYLMALHPEIQEKAHQELEQELGQRAPSASDRIKLKYFDALIHELHRYAVILPLGAPMHRVTKDVYVRGHRLPEDASVFVNMFAVFRDAKMWPYPDELNVNNFYDEKTKSLKNTECFIPFMIGKRACPGESLAKQELFLFCASLLHRFKFTLDKDFVNSEKPTYSMYNRFPPAHKVIATNRL